MAESGADPSRLEALRVRWERDPASRLFLQLAEEYRRDGRPDEAVKVLATGLEHHPGYLAARVALGRCRLETGDAAGAAAALERVIAADPTQLVANKLLIATYLRLGRVADARDRLDLYVLLNEADPEIDDLERQLMAAEDAAAPASLPELPTAYGELEGLAGRSASAGPAPRALPAEAAGARPLARRPAAEVDLERVPLPGAARRRVDAAALPPPFPSLAGPGVRRGTGPLAALAAGGIFRWQAASPAVAVAAAEPALLEPLGEEELAVPLEVEEIAAPETAARWWEAKGPLPSPEAAATPEAVPEAEVEVAAQVEVEPEIEPLPEAEPQETGRPWWQLPRAEPPEAIAPAAPEAWERPVPEPFTPSWPEAVEPVEPPGAVEPPPSALEEETPPEPAPEPLPEPLPPLVAELAAAPGAEVEPAEAPEATTTLAHLYLQQGHLAEASAAYAAVLARRPGDAEALAGLERIAERRSRPLGAAELLGGTAPPAGLTARKVLLLQRYLQRIREGAKRHVP